MLVLRPLAVVLVQIERRGTELPEQPTLVVVVVVLVQYRPGAVMAVRALLSFAIQVVTQLLSVLV
jgi:hypothetical protein